MKRCPSCGVDKPYSDFYKNRAQSDGFSCQCKKCENDYKRDHVPESRKEYIKKYLRNYRSNGNGGKGKYRADNHEKIIATKFVYYAVKCGYIEKPNCCEKCGKTKPLHGHHVCGYYGKDALNVLWLCHSCHMREHRT